MMCQLGGKQVLKSSISFNNFSANNFSYKEHLPKTRVIGTFIMHTFTSTWCHMLNVLHLMLLLLSIPFVLLIIVGALEVISII